MASQADNERLRRLQGRHDLAPALWITAVGGVERNALNDITVTVIQFWSDLFRKSDYCESIEDLVGDERAHLVPFTLL